MRTAAQTQPNGEPPLLSLLLRPGRARASIARAQSTRSAGKLRTAKLSSDRAPSPPDPPLRRARTSGGRAKVAASTIEREDEQRRYDAPRKLGPALDRPLRGRRRGVRSLVLEPGRGQPIEMPGAGGRRAAVHPPISPRGEQVTWLQSRTRIWIKRPRWQAHFHPKLIAIPPCSRCNREGFEHLHGLWRWAARPDHPQ